MAEEARDSGICVDNDDSPSLSTSSSLHDFNLSYVQRLRKRFECLAKEQEKEFHSECNWWLEEEIAEDDSEVNCVNLEEEKVHDAKNKTFARNASTESAKHTFSKQSSIKSQISRESQAKIKVAPVTPENLPLITFTDYQENNETNDSDSFESESEDEVETVEIENEKSVDEEVEDDLPVELIRNSRQSMKLMRPISVTSQTSNISNTKLFNIVRELLENEENYVKSLNTGINNYMTVFDSKELPKTLRGQKHRIFGNIKSIYKLHAHEFLPSLAQCFDDPEQIAEVFTSYVSRDFFYGYIIYAINRKRSELLCNYHGDFFKKIQNRVGDRLGINSFLLQPIQRLPRYQLLLNEIIKDLSKDLENTKQAIAACCIAEKNIQRLLDSVNESMSICDIRNCYEIDVLCQGKFKKMNEFDIYDWELRRRFRGKVFLFERCVVYTEALEREYLEYRGHLGNDKLGIIYKEGKSKFKLFAKRRGQKEVEFRASLSTVVEWNEMLTGMLMKFVVEEKKRQETRQRKGSLVSMRQIHIPDSVRSSMASTKSDLSNFSISSYRSSSGNSSLGRESSSFDPRKSKWYV